MNQGLFLHDYSLITVLFPKQTTVSLLLLTPCKNFYLEGVSLNLTLPSVTSCVLCLRSEFSYQTTVWEAKAASGAFTESGPHPEDSPGCALGLLPHPGAAPSCSFVPTALHPIPPDL